MTWKTGVCYKVHNSKIGGYKFIVIEYGEYVMFDHFSQILG